MTTHNPSSDEFHGFDKARAIMWCYEARARVVERLALTDFVANAAIAAVHVDNTSRADRVYLTAFDERGCQLSSDTLYTDEAGHHLDVAPEFDHDFTGMSVASGSELDAAVEREYGWVINMQALRAYDALADHRATQRAVVLAHLADMMRRGDANGFLFDPGDSGSAGAA
ncbi:MULTISPECIES: hypothetical protein [Arthrobacter]|uniref:hypothetical protein n=1 Tax=Arthrobacter TaxID=1663 RepID=UPI00197A9F13|nr:MULTISPECIES: hypothetical protein [Arthrobacter]MBT8162929.1 hypothetical protein [Arthrobacter sp. GN70]